jgi:hypothetical protein
MLVDELGVEALEREVAAGEVDVVVPLVGDGAGAQVGGNRNVWDLSSWPRTLSASDGSVAAADRRRVTTS